ncbi:MAG: hypothetical protein INR67_15690, partial [Jatrophihabitans endophyticus]|nr:hypothetical protein [Jatrophihabitans endophyticus]
MIFRPALLAAASASLFLTPVHAQVFTPTPAGATSTAAVDADKAFVHPGIF